MSKQSTPILTLTRKSAGAIGAGRFVTAAGAQAGADANALGVAKVAAAGANEQIPVVVLGTAVVETGGAVAEGQTLKSDASGRAIAWVTSGARLAIALQAAAGAGEFIEVLLIPNAA